MIEYGTIMVPYIYQGEEPFMVPLRTLFFWSVHLE